MTNYRRHRGVTLIELLVSLAALSVLVLYFAAFEQIARQDLFGTERRARVQNDAALILETITKEVKKVIGNPTMTLSGNSINPIYRRTTGAQVRLKFVWDSNNNGTFDDGTDQIGCFKLREGGTYQVIYSPNNGGGYGGGACAGGGTTISYRVVATSVNLPNNDDAPFSLTSNNIIVSVTTCWDPDGVPNVCGHQENPQVQMNTTITMPMVSVR